VFRVSLQLLSKIFFILRRIERAMIKNVYWSSCFSTLYSCPVLMKLGFSEQVFEKYSNIKFHENPPSGSRVVPWGQTNGGTDMINLPVASRNCVNAPINFLHELSPKSTWCVFNPFAHITWKIYKSVFLENQTACKSITKENGAKLKQK